MAETTLITGRKDNSRASGGFTLLELILVMVLISVLLGIAAPSLRGFHGARRSADAAAQVLCLANYARSQSIAQGAVYRLNIDVDERVYWLTTQAGGAFVELSNEFGRRFALPDNMTVTIKMPVSGDVTPYVQFYPDGRCDEAAITLTDLQGDAFEIGSPSATEPMRIFSLPEGEGS